MFAPFPSLSRRAALAYPRARSRANPPRADSSADPLFDVKKHLPLFTNAAYRSHSCPRRVLRRGLLPRLPRPRLLARPH